MNVRALFFATYRDLVGTSELALDLPDGATAGDAVRLLRMRGEPFDRLPECPALAVDHVYVTADARLHHGSELAFIPPVAGG